MSTTDNEIIRAISDKPAVVASLMSAQTGIAFEASHIHLWAHRGRVPRKWRYDFAQIAAARVEGFDLGAFMSGAVHSANAASAGEAES